MSERIRLYNSVNDEGEIQSSIVGFGCQLGFTEDGARENINSYLAANNQTMAAIETPAHLAHIEADYYEIIPPLREHQVRRLASLCMSYVSRGRHTVYFIDNRATIPERYFQEAGDVIDWI